MGSHSLRLILTRPDAAFLYKLAFPAFGPQSPANIKKYGGGGDLIRHPVGTGPFRFVEWTPDDHITLERTPDYWGTPPALHTLTYRVIKEAPARLLELQAGTVDGVDNLSPDDIPLAQADAALDVYLRPPFNVGFLGINRAHPPFDDVRVRQAVALAIDREELVRALYPPTAQAATQFVPPGIFGHTEDLEGWAYDPARARALLAEAGYPDGFRTTLWVMGIGRPYFPHPDRVGEVLQADLAAVGIQAELVTYDWGTYLEKMYAGEADLFLNGWMADFPDATNFLDTFFTGGDDNLGPPFPELVEWLQAAAATADPAGRQALYDRANAFIRDHVPAVPVVHNSSALAFRDTVHGLAASPFSQELFYPVTVDGKDHLVFGRSGDSVGLDCVDESDFESLMVCAQIFEPLVAFKPGTTEIVPGLAERWEVSDDLLTWTFYLRQGVKFHDGTDLDAEAVAFNFERWWDPENPYHVGHTGNFVHWTYYFGGFKGE
ncbi:MAG: peptide ABC transporter substrate-binding protein [Anaerolineae bacterium]|nr:peptide ABC transporter substrate-binding protein [Anaerolineae bacterium]